MKVYMTLVDFYEKGKSEKWNLPFPPNEGAIININGIKREVKYIEYIFSSSVAGDHCNVFIHTEKEHNPDDFAIWKSGYNGYTYGHVQHNKGEEIIFRGNAQECENEFQKYK